MVKFETLKESKEYLRENWKEGVKCPCCGQLVKLYERALYSTQMVSLIKLYKMSRGYHHIRDIEGNKKSGGGDFAKLLHWKFVEEEPKDPDDKAKRTSGMWRITDKGRDFVENKTKAPSHALIYNGIFIGLKPESLVSVKDALGKKFNYEELMQ